MGDCNKLNKAAQVSQASANCWLHRTFSATKMLALDIAYSPSNSCLVQLATRTPLTLTVAIEDLYGLPTLCPVFYPEGGDCSTVAEAYLRPRGDAAVVKVRVWGEAGRF